MGNRTTHLTWRGDSSPWGRLMLIKAHGSSKRVAIKNAIFQAVSYAESDVAEKIKQKLDGEEIIIEN